MGMRLVLLAAAASLVSGITDNGHVTEVVGVEDRSVDLPCNITSTYPDDSAVLVLWYRDDEGIPTYSFDGRNDRSFSERSEIGDRGTVVRATFIHGTRPAVLRLATVRRQDAGRYRCRVDFRFSPTRNHRLRLSVIIPPGEPEFIHDGQTVSGIIGPLQEGQPLEVTCRSRGGRPPPRVTWFRDGRLLDDTDSGDQGSGQVTNVLRLPPLGRDDLHSSLVCSAANNNISSPVISKLVIEMSFRPLSVSILGSAQTSLEPGHPYELVCHIVGSRPPANVTWWIGQRRLTGDTLMEMSQGNITSSTLPFTPTAADNGRFLRCRAENRLVRDGVLEDSRVLNVRFAPIVSLRLGPSLDPKNIREGQDVYFECDIKANPVIYSLSWLHNDRPIVPSLPSVEADIVSINGHSLVIRNLTRRSAGRYVCRAVNPEGETDSRPIHMAVLYSPVCVTEQQIQYGTAKSEPAQVTCQVDANPADVTFRWQFNTSIETLDLPFSQITSSGMRSRALYTPKTDLDYGILVCAADNGIGHMARPCVFHIVPAGPPDPVHNCSVVNQTSESLRVVCSAGFDGGLPQRFSAELYDATSGRLERNLSAGRPEFEAERLPAGVELRVRLYAFNARGRSRPTTLDGFTLKAAEKRISSSSSSSSNSASSSSNTGTEAPPDHGLMLTPLLAILIGVVASLIIIAVGVVVCFKLGSRRQAKPPAPQADLIHSSLMLKERMTPSPAPDRPTVVGAKLGDSENPDVIPSGHCLQINQHPSVHDSGYDLAPTSHLLNHLSVSWPRKGSPNLSPRPMSHQIGCRRDQGGVPFDDLTLPRSGHAGRTARPADSQPVVTFATFNPRRPALATSGVRTVRSADQESVV
ncbi:nephrin-like [Amphibalanus amphitrite]|uniref:nephrin-like n=1 Tax=Amphibalanus amphitrite TaxID=1232801 RepID=UPI001C91C036|nr:nephrin-like [Amphibalanus amphitrite]